MFEDNESRRSRILVVEDDVKLAELVREYLSANAFDVSVEHRGDRAETRILNENPDLVVLDLMLPGKDGLAVCRQVRQRYRGAILMLTARGEEVDEVVGLEIGADDYMAKPVRPRLLLARIKTLLRRLQKSEQPQDATAEQAKGDKLVLGKLRIDCGRREAFLLDDQLTLTTAEFDLLLYLAQRAGQIVDRDQIYEELRGIAYDGLDRSIDLRVARLRKKLGDDGRKPRLIKSVRGAGYLLVASVT